MMMIGLGYFLDSIDEDGTTLLLNNGKKIVWFQLPTHDLRAILRRNVNVHSIRLGKNPWRCDCEVTPDLQSFLAEFQHLIQDHSDIRCAELHNDAKSLKRVRFNSLFYVKLWYNLADQSIE